MEIGDGRGGVSFHQSNRSFWAVPDVFDYFQMFQMKNISLKRC
jgi:hypothetical protein